MLLWGSSWSQETSVDISCSKLKPKLKNRLVCPDYYWTAKSINHKRFSFCCSFRIIHFVTAKINRMNSFWLSFNLPPMSEACRSFLPVILNFQWICIVMTDFRFLWIKYLFSTFGWLIWRRSNDEVPADNEVESLVSAYNSICATDFRFQCLGAGALAVMKWGVESLGSAAFHIEIFSCFEAERKIHLRTMHRKVDATNRSRTGDLPLAG